jgi:peroxiredoxin
MRLILAFALLFTAISLSAQSGYKIDFTVKGLHDTTAYLGYFYQEKTYVADTAKVNATGNFSFDGSKTLPQGIYFLVLDKSRVFDFVVGENQRFSLATSTEDYIKNMVVKGDEDNQLFFENIFYNDKIQKEAEPNLKIVKDSTLKDDAKKAAREALTELNKKVTMHSEEIILLHPKTLTVRFMNINRPVKIPEPPKKANGTIDSTFQLKWYRQHYFDYFDLADEAMLRMPKVFYWDKVKDYLDRLYIQQPDTIAKAVDGLVAIAKKNKETYKYLVWNVTVNYQNPSIMGLDEVYVHMYDKYFATGEMDYWLDKKTIQNMKEFADKVRLATIGTIAPNLIMQNEKLQPKALYDIKNKYTIIFFFKPTCSHCREETPKLVNFYTAKKAKYNLEVFAVATDTSMKEMRDFIKEFKTPWTTVNGPRTFQKEHFSKHYYAELTPTVYIIDEKKKIIARKIDVEQIDNFLTNYESMLKRKQSAPPKS